VLSLMIDCLNDRTSSRRALCLIAISRHYLIAFNRLGVEYVVTCRSVIGWQQIDDKTLRVYYHINEWLSLKLITTSADTATSMSPITALKTRLENVTRGVETVDVIIRHNSSSLVSHRQRTCGSLLGFRMSSDGVVIDVDLFSQAYNSGLRVGTRVLEICKISLNQLKTSEELVDLLNTSMTVSLTTIPNKRFVNK
jgi:hypothetical protein